MLARKNKKKFQEEPTELNVRFISVNVTMTSLDPQQGRTPLGVATEHVDVTTESTEYP